MQLGDMGERCKICGGAPAEIDFDAF